MYVCLLACPFDHVGVGVTYTLQQPRAIADSFVGGLIPPTYYYQDSLTNYCTMKDRLYCSRQGLPNFTLVVVYINTVQIVIHTSLSNIQYAICYLDNIPDKAQVNCAHDLVHCRLSPRLLQAQNPVPIASARLYSRLDWTMISRCLPLLYHYFQQLRL